MLHHSVNMLPSLVSIHDLKEPIGVAKGAIAHVRAIMNDVEAPTPFDLEAYLVRLVSHFEGMLTDVLALCINLRSKSALDNKDLVVSKEDVLENFTVTQILDKAIERKVIELSMKNSMDKYLVEFFKLADIPAYTDQGNLESLQEIVATRNLIAHNNLKVNGRYLVYAGPQKRSDKRGETLRVRKDYVLAACDVFEAIINHLETEVQTKYGFRTRIFVLRQLWGTIFDTPMMPFDDFWVINTAEDRISRSKQDDDEELAENISTTEHLFFKIWKNEYHGNNDLHLRPFTMRHFDPETTQRLLAFLEAIQEINLEGY